MFLFIFKYDTLEFYRITNNSEIMKIVLSKIYKGDYQENFPLINGSESTTTRNLKSDTNQDSSNTEVAVPQNEISYSELFSPKYRYALFI